MVDSNTYPFFDCFRSVHSWFNCEFSRLWTTLFCCQSMDIFENHYFPQLMFPNGIPIMWHYTLTYTVRQIQTSSSTKSSHCDEIIVVSTVNGSNPSVRILSGTPADCANHHEGLLQFCLNLFICKLRDARQWIWSKL